MHKRARRIGRALLAVSKTFDADAVLQAYQAGRTAFGKITSGGGWTKISRLRELALQWHCIQPHPNNKTRLVAQHFDWVHTVDRLKIARASRRTTPRRVACAASLHQVNIDGGPTKSGVAPTGAGLARRRITAAVALRGLMCIRNLL